MINDQCSLIDTQQSPTEGRLSFIIHHSSFIIHLQGAMAVATTKGKTWQPCSPPPTEYLTNWWRCDVLVRLTQPAQLVAVAMPQSVFCVNLSLFASIGFTRHEANC